MSSQHETQVTTTDTDVVVVGAGFAGLYLLHRLRGQGLNVRVFEAGSGVGGTWFWNRYPGARCDVESLDYQYSFSEDLLREWKWTERYPRQDELLAYLNFVADRLKLRDGITLDTRVTGALFDEAANTWAVETDKGDKLTTRYVIMGTGCLSTAKRPEFQGLDSFQGDWYHTGSWPHEGVDFTGKRVAVIGTGSSGMQTIPIVAEQADHVFVLQRTANYSVPANNGPLAEETVAEVLDSFEDRRKFARESFLGFSVPSNEQSALAVSEEERNAEFEARWQMGGLPMYGAFADILIDPAANDTAVEFFRGKIRERVADPATAELLTPKGYRLGAKRICVDTDYLETFNRDNVTLLDVKVTPIERITPNGVHVDGVEHEMDAIIFATGFDAMTGSMMKIDVRGRGGVTLQQKWSEGPKTYLGLAIAGFPNMFMVTGPGSPSVFSNMIVSIEQHVEWISDALEHATANSYDAFEATDAAETEWVDHVNLVADSTLLPEGNSWYIGANIPGKPRVFMPYLGGVGAYRQKCDEVAAAGYDGFTLRSTLAVSQA
ncbi:MAG TPA: NAD(P)/FAD-dependent oxidoreductase [Aldersonia sp.]